jgi:ferrochelatase
VGLETLEEIGAKNAQAFREAGGERFAALPCLNDSEEGMAVLEAVARRELMGWAGQAARFDKQEGNRRCS